MFVTIIRIDLDQAFDLGLLVFSLAAALATFAIAWLVALFLEPQKDRGVMVQAAFRSNLGVIGLALCASAYGEGGLALASVLMAALTVLYNVLSLFILSVYSKGAFIPGRVLLDIAKNPLILAIVTALGLAWTHAPVPVVLLEAGGYLGAMALPLALLGTGAGMSIKTLRASSEVTAVVVLLKAALLPGVVTGLAWWLGYRGSALGVLFLLFASPTASASYAMVAAMGANDRLAANLITTTTLACIATCSAGLFLLALLE